MKFNVLEHKLVPEHKELTREESEEVLKNLKVTIDQLPKIRREDPVVLILRKIKTGRIKEASVEGKDNPAFRSLEDNLRKQVKEMFLKGRDEQAAELLENAGALLPEGTVVRITRLSDTAGVCEAYRLVVGR